MRARHVFRGEEVSQRADIQFTVDFPLTWRYVEREKLGKIKAWAGQELELRHGEGRILDLSYGGAALVTQVPLAPGGLAQLQFTIHKQPVHRMLELMSDSQTLDSEWVHRSRFRGMSQEIKSRLFNFLSREQVVRLREKEVIRGRPGDSA